jgi:hypothetical protein
MGSFAQAWTYLPPKKVQRICVISRERVNIYSPRPAALCQAPDPENRMISILLVPRSGVARTSDRMAR